jgi:hypothetical protein
MLGDVTMGFGFFEATEVMESGYRICNLKYEKSPHARLTLFGRSNGNRPLEDLGKHGA